MNVSLTIKKMTEKFQRKKKNNFVFKQFDGFNIDKAINMLIYGVEVKKIKNKKFATEKLRIHIKEDNFTTLQCLSFKKKSVCKSKINIGRINNLDELPPMKISSVFKKENLLSINYSDNKELVIEFANEQKKMLFWEGVQYFYQMTKDITTIIKFHISFKTTLYFFFVFFLATNAQIFQKNGPL